MTVEMLVVDRRFMTLDHLIWRKLLREVPGLVEDTLDRNPGLAALGSHLPHGTTVAVDIAAPASPGSLAPRALIRLVD